MRWRRSWPRRSGANRAWARPRRTYTGRLEDARGLSGMFLEQDPFVQGAQAVAEPSEDRLDVSLAGVVRDGEVGDGLVVEIAPAQVVEVVAHGPSSKRKKRWRTRK